MDGLVSTRPKAGRLLHGSLGPGAGSATMHCVIFGINCGQAPLPAYRGKIEEGPGHKAFSGFFVSRKIRAAAESTVFPLFDFLFFCVAKRSNGYILRSRYHSKIMGEILTQCLNVCKRFTFCVKERLGVLFFCTRAGKDASVQGGGMKGRLVLGFWHVLMLACVLWPFSALAENSYVGTAACKDCHEEQHENFTKYAKKAHSDRSVKVMASDLSEAELKECYGCHSTGYGQPGGFVSYEKTPELADAGCEVCHGPGYEHVESGGDAELIKGKLTMDDCVGCHNAERVQAFNFKPLLYGGAH